MEHVENDKAYKGLTVNSGVAQPSIVNPYLKRGRYHHRELSAADYVEGILKGDVTVLGRAVTLVESTNPAHQAVAQEVLAVCPLVPVRLDKKTDRLHEGKGFRSGKQRVNHSSRRLPRRGVHVRLSPVRVSCTSRRVQVLMVAYLDRTSLRISPKR